MNSKTHWEQVYATKTPAEVSWFQTKPILSLQFIKKSGISKTDPIIDVGGGASVLVDSLLDEHFRNLALLDISGKALEVTKSRLGERAGLVQFFEADVRTFQPKSRFALWHDRAVLHFLINKADRVLYLDSLQRSLLPGGHAIIATFAVGGPKKCSGLDIVQFSPVSIIEEFGANLELIESVEEIHATPSGGEQKFNYFLLKNCTPAV